MEAKIYGDHEGLGIIFIYPDETNENYDRLLELAKQKIIYFLDQRMAFDVMINSKYLLDWKGGFKGKVYDLPEGFEFETEFRSIFCTDQCECFCSLDNEHSDTCKYEVAIITNYQERNA